VTGARTLTGRIRVGLPPAAAFRLFTARGEQDWADGWEPHFPAAAPDDTEPGTVFETTDHGQRTTWVVTEREPGRRIGYARVTPGDRAGTVTVALAARGDGSEAEVTYRLTALSERADAELGAFAAGYADFLASWESDIAALLGG
jgi:Polyketide cyclase / dehydrase and lipid transport